MAQAGLCQHEIRRQQDLAAPAFFWSPAAGAEVLCRGLQGVGDAVPDIGTAIPVAVPRVAPISGGHKLGLSHGASPRAGHSRGLGLAAVDDAQGFDQFGGEEIPSPAVIRQGGQCGDHGEAAGLGAIVRFHPPQCDEQFGGDTVAMLDTCKQRGMFLKQCPTAGDARLGDRSLQVVGKGANVFSLPPVQGDDRANRLDTPECHVQRGWSDADRSGVRP